MRCLPRRRHRLAQARGAAARRRDVHDHRPRQPERDVREQEADRDGGARGRRRGADRQVPAHLPAPMSTTTPTERRTEQQRLHTIGAVCARLQPEFPDISISKIRYLEDQGLLTPKRTRGGYRPLQRGRRRAARDDPPAAARRVPTAPCDPAGAGLGRGWGAQAQPPGGLGDREPELDLAELCERAGIDQTLARALEEYGLLSPRVEGVSASTGRAMPTSPPPAGGSPSSGSTRGTCGRSGTRPDARRACSSSSSRRRSARATPSGARRASTTCRRWPRRPRSSRSCSSGVSCASWRTGSSMGRRPRAAKGSCGEGHQPLRMPLLRGLDRLPR